MAMGCHHPVRVESTISYASRRRSIHDVLVALCVLSWGTLIRQALNSISPSDDVHERDTGYFAYPAAQFAIACGDDVDGIGLHTLDNAVISIRPPVVAL